MEKIGYPEDINGPEEQIQKIETLLKQKGIEYRLSNYSPDVENAAEAAEQIDFPLEKIVKSLVFKSKDSFILLLVPSPKKVDVQTASQKLSSKIDMASREEVSEATGYEIGAVTVFELKTELPVYIDSSIMEYDEIGISSGVRGIEVIMDPKDLNEVSGAEVLELT